MTPNPTRVPRGSEASYDADLIQRRLLDQYGTELAQTRGLRRWFLERKLRREVATRIAQEADRAQRRSSRHQVHLF
jgi:hypothetical protein